MQILPTDVVLALAAIMEGETKHRWRSDYTRQEIVDRLMQNHGVVDQQVGSFPWSDSVWANMSALYISKHACICILYACMCTTAALFAHCTSMLHLVQSGRPCAS